MQHHFVQVLVLQKLNVSRAADPRVHVSIHKNG